MLDISKKKWTYFTIFAIIGFIIDWYTKYLVVANMKLGSSIPILGNLLEWFFVYNKGALFGLTPKSIFPNFPVNIFFYIFSMIASVLIVIYYKNLEEDKKLSLWGVALIMPGALGNLFDRVVHPENGVVDFIKVDLGFPPFNPWPIFNMADIYITVGIIMIFIDVIFFDKKDTELIGADDEK